MIPVWLPRLALKLLIQPHLDGPSRYPAQISSEMFNDGVQNGTTKNQALQETLHIKLIRKKWI